MTTTADLVREMIQETVGRVRQNGSDIITGGSERMQELWMEVDAHLQAADLCDLLGDFDHMTRHFDCVNGLLDRIADEIPE